MPLNLPDELRDLAKAIGLCGADGELDTSWFGDVFARAQKVLSDPAQRAAFLSLLDRIAPSADLEGIADGEQWYPLLGEQPRGNAYLTVRALSEGALIGLAADIHGATAGGPADEALRVHLPLLHFTTGTPRLAAGGADAPLIVDLRVRTALDRGNGDPITLEAMRVGLRWSYASSGAPSIAVVMEGYELDDEGRRELSLDPAQLGSSAIEVISAVVKQILPSDGPTAALRHLLGLMGFDDDAVPALPLHELTQGPAALQTWLKALIDGDQLATWLGHFAGLVGLPAATLGDASTLGDPLRVRLLELGDNGGIELGVALANDRLHVSFAVRAAAAGAAPPGRLDARITLVAIPLNGTGSALVLPDAHVLIAAPGGPGKLVDQPSTIVVDRLNAGVRWDAAQRSVVPVLELLGVTLQSLPRREQIDLTHADSVVDAVASGLQAALIALLGGAGAPLLAFAGLAEPQSAGVGWPHRLTAARLSDFAAAPTRTLGLLHRAALNDPTHHWGFLLDELRRLLNLPGALAGVGTAASPWVVPLANSGAISIRIAAWNDAPGAAIAKLRLGLRAQIASNPWELTWRAVLLGFDIDASGDADARLFSGQSMSVGIAPLPPLGPDANVVADSASVSLSFQPSTGLRGHAALTNLRIRVDETDFALGTLELPAASPFDLGDATTLPIAGAELQRVISALLTQALSETLGAPGVVVAALSGLHAQLPGLPADWPTVFDPADALRIASDPAAALQSYARRIVQGANPELGPYLPRLLGWAQALLVTSASAPLSLSTTADRLPLPRGSGTYADPWRLGLGQSSDRARSELLLWLEPDGAPGAWRAALAGAIDGSGSALTMLQAAAPLVALVPELQQALQGTPIAVVAAGLGELGRSLEDSDGFVPLGSQLIEHDDWQHGAVVPDAAHLDQPKHPQLIAQALDQIEAWQPLAERRAVLLLHPACATAECWSELIAEAQQRDPNALAPGHHFNLRIAGADPLALALNDVTGASRIFTADLADDGGGNHSNLAQQIARVAARIADVVPASTQLFIVAHSTAGIAARQFAADNQDRIAGLITIGTPHRGAALDALRDPTLTQALRVAARWLDRLEDGPIRAALTQLSSALDAFTPAGTNALPALRVFPVGSFVPAASVATSGVPALALGSRLGGDVFLALRGGLSALATAAPAGNPTHLGFGARVALGERFDGLALARVHVRADLGRIALTAGAPEPARPAHALVATLSLSDPMGGYLVGPPQAHVAIGEAIADVHVRSVQVGLRLTRAAGGPLTAQLEAEALDAAFRSETKPRLTLDDPLLPAVLGAAFDRAFNPAPALGSSLGELSDALQAIGLLASTAQQRIGLALDAFSALRAEPLPLLLPRLQAALDRPVGWLGLRADGAGGYAFPLGELSVSARPDNGAWRLGLAFARDLAPTGSTLPLRVTFDAGIETGGAQPLHAVGDLALALGPASFDLTLAASGPALSLRAEPWIEDRFELIPAPSAAEIRALLNELVPRFLASSALSQLLGGVLRASGAPASRVLALDPLITAPARFLTRPSALGASSSTAGAAFSLDGGKVATLLSTIARALGQAGPAVELPGSLRLTCSGAQVVTLTLATGAPIGGVLSLATTLTIDELLHPKPGGTVAIAVPASGAFAGLAIAFGIDAQGHVTLVVTPTGGTPIQLLPTFSGLGALISGAVDALLPAVLDAVTTALPVSPVKTQALAVAQALSLYDSVNGFGGHAAAFRELLANRSLASIATTARPAFLSAASAVIHQLLAAAQVDVDAGRLRWTASLPASVQGQLRVALGWDATGASFKVEAHDLRINGAPLVLRLAGGFELGQLTASATLGADLSGIHIAATPALAFTSNGGAVTLALRPFGADDAAPLEVRLLPVPQLVATDALPAELATRWLLPIAAALLFEVTRSKHATLLWAGGPSVGAVLDKAQLRNGVDLAATLPDLKTIVIGTLKGLLDQIAIPIGELQVSGSGDAGRIGVKLRGKLPIEIGDYKLTLYCGERPSGPMGQLDAGITLNLFTTTELALTPQLRVRGLGLGFANRQDKPLVANDVVRIGELAAFTFFDVELSSAFSTARWGFELDLARFGLPLGAVMGDTSGGDNPVAASLLSSSSGQGGDSSPINPECDLVARYVDGEGFSLTIGGTNAALWITIQKQLGPLYIEQIGIQTLDAGQTIGLLLDGGVKVSGLSIQVDDLTLLIPLRSPTDVGIDLKGMAVALNAGAVKIAGGLIKNSGPPVSYDGALMVDVAGRGFTAIGSYARPRDELGDFVSFFAFVSLPIPLGGPPYFFVLGLGGGAGINRALIVPTDMNEIPSFPLVAAIGDSGFANDPMAALRAMGTNIPPRRGGFWLAAGLKFSTFVIVESVAVVYVALDRGLEVGLLGLSRMALPSEESAIAQIELALKARFSTAEGLLSVQAQLTDRSYLFHPACQLTGGFAFFLWFRTGRFVLTLGGYHKAFTKPADFPDVPRLGFRWNVSNAIVIKGESYFALTTTCVMAGGRLEASYRGGPIHAWFHNYLDVLVSWDPFYYAFEAGIEVGAEVDTFFGNVSVSMGARVHVEGPPLFGWVEVELIVTTVRIEFGDPAHDVQYLQAFNIFHDKYLSTGDPKDHAVDVHLRSGLLPTVPPGADPAPGSFEAPWVIGAEWTLDSETRMPCNALRWKGAARSLAGSLDDAIDLAPMNRRGVTSRHALELRTRAGLPLVLDDDRFIVEPISGNFPEATWRWQDPAAVQAGAANIQRLAGVKLQGIAELVHQSPLIRIKGVVDDLPERALPLPFDQPSDHAFTELRLIGAQAVELSAITRPWSRALRQTVSEQLLTSLELAPARQALGVAARGLSPLARRELATRSAPPRIVPLSTGMTMDAPAQAAPPTFALTTDRSKQLERPRLLAVMRQRVTPTSAQPSALRTTVSKVKAARSAVRVTAPRAKPLAGARLQRVPAARAAAPTRVVLGERTLLHPAFGASSTTHASAFDHAEKRVGRSGVSLPPNTTQLWQLPQTVKKPGQALRLQLSGDAVARVTWLSASGDVLSDLELAPGAHPQQVLAPNGAGLVAITCLGRITGKLPASLVAHARRARLALSRAPALGLVDATVSQALAASGSAAAIGWQSGSALVRLGAQTFLARGATVEVGSVPTTVARGAASAGVVNAGSIMAKQRVVTTRLPAKVQVVIIELDGGNDAAAASGDLAISAEGGELVTPPSVVVAGARRTLIYDVRRLRAAEASALSVSVASRGGYIVAGVVGVWGRAAEWSEQLTGANAPELIGPQALSAEGAVTVHLLQPRRTR